MNFTVEQMNKAKSAKSEEELLEMAKESGIEMTKDEATKYYAELHIEGELSDDELDNVSGGCGDDDEPKPKYSVGDSVWVNYNDLGMGTITDRAYVNGIWTYIVHIEYVSFGGRIIIHDLNLEENYLGR